MKLENIVTKKVIRRLLNGDDYRAEILALINAQFLEYAIEFFKKIANAKFENEHITKDWYKYVFLDNKLPTDEIIINSGLNRKTISNMYNSARREIVLEVTEEYYDELLESVLELAEADTELEIELTIRFRGVSVHLNLSESLIVINSLAVKRAQLRGGAWSTAGKQVENPLLTTLSYLYGVPSLNFSGHGLTGQGREVDFHLIGRNKKRYFCEVKLMGQGNPESADAVIARDTDIFVADKLSNLNKQQLDNLNIHWVEMRQKNGFEKFETVLTALDIPHTKQNPIGDLDRQLDLIFARIFDE